MCSNAAGSARSSIFELAVRAPDRQIKFTILSYGRAACKTSRCESETKIYSNPTQRRHRGTLKDSGATLSASQIRIIMSACLLRSVIRDFISPDKRIKERIGQISAAAVAGKTFCKEKSRLEFMMAGLLLSPVDSEAVSLGVGRRARAPASTCACMHRMREYTRAAGYIHIPLSGLRTPG